MHKRVVFPSFTIRGCKKSNVYKYGDVILNPIRSVRKRKDIVKGWGWKEHTACYSLAWKLNQVFLPIW